MREPLLKVENLTTVFDADGGPLVGVDGVSFEICSGETLALVGESGSGKTVTAFSIIRLLQPPGRVASGRVIFQGRDLVTATEEDLRRVRGAGIGFVFQEPATALNPVLRIGTQIAETLVVHGVANRRDARRRAIELLAAVRIPEPERRVDDYPHELSGGMLQRVMIAIALACRPPLVIADEPTTALDVTVQAQVLDLLRSFKRELDLSLLLITHDLGVVAETADRVAVMYAGRIVEEGPVRAIFREPLHPYTRALLASIPGERSGKRLQAIDGAVPGLAQLPPGCTFAPRCPQRMQQCTTEVPALASIAPGHSVRCYLHSDQSEPAAAPLVRDTADNLPSADAAHAAR